MDELTDQELFDLIKSLIDKRNRQEDYRTWRFLYKGFETKGRIYMPGGGSTKIPFLGFLANNNEIKDGIYPAILYYFEHKILVIAYGISDDNPLPKSKWSSIPQKETIQEFWKREFGIDCPKYGTSFYKYHFKLPLNDTDQKKLIEELNIVIDEYNLVFPPRRNQANPLPNTPVLQAAPNPPQPMKPNLNTILYGPPGTGKTYKLNEYKELYFTDRGITKSSDEVLKEKVSEYHFWEILAAVLGTSSMPLKVPEIVKHPLVKAWVNPSNKAKPSALAWSDLQSRADDSSTNLHDSLRSKLKLFRKENQSKWTIIPDRKEELPGIIGQELIDLASNPSLKLASSSYIERFKFITFHQKYSYEDFIEGIRPRLQGDDADESSGNLKFELKKGVFYNCCLKALELVGYSSFKECHEDSFENRKAKFNAVKNIPEKQFAILIDEINRANISAVFGELITLIEEDKRIGTSNEVWLDLPYNNEKFCVPPNLYIIGTMNTADRSIALLDIALRRRFQFESLYPRYDLEDAKMIQPFKLYLKNLNKAIYENLRKNTDFFIGHSFFMNTEKRTYKETDLKNILNKKIIPLLYEYCQNDATKIYKILDSANPGSIEISNLENNYRIVAK